MSGRSLYAFCCLAGLSVLLAGGCGGTGDGAAPTEAAGGPVATVGTAVVDRGEVRELIETFGTVEFDPQTTHTISFVNSGQVLRLLVTTGQSVSEGDPLLLLGPLPSSSLEMEQARINLEYADRNLQRLKRLRENHLATNEAVDLADKDVASAAAVLNGLGAGQSVKPEEIRSPFSGVVVNVLTTSGALVHQGDNGFLVAPADGVAVRAGFEPENAAHVRPDMEVLISPVFGDDADQLVHARLSRFHMVVDPTTQLVEALIHPAGKPVWLVSGTDVRVRVVVNAVGDAVRVPRGALVSRDGARGVFVIAAGRAHWTPLDLGIQGESWAEVQRGLSPGDVVATEGRTSLADGMAVKAAGGGSP